MLFCLLVSSFAYGQKESELAKVSNVNFYGVDYSMVKVNGATEAPIQFQRVFADINFLFISEAKKYDVAKFIKKTVDKVDLEVVNKVNAEINLNDLMAKSTSYALEDAAIAKHIKSLPIKDTKGIGFILVAQLLDKAASRGTYQLVYFDLESRNIISSRVAGGKAGGFGLRNFWAASVYKALKPADHYFE